MADLKKKWIVSLDVGATHVSAGLVSTAGEIKCSREMATHDEKDQTPLGRRIIRFTGELLKAGREADLKPVGIAVGAPGIVDSDKGVLVVAGNLPELMGMPLQAELEEKFGLPARLENDVNARAAGEMLFGVARGCRNFVLFALGTDLGGGIVIDGKVHRGAHYIAAEFGHLTLDLEGQSCICGGVGCVREWVSGTGIAHKAHETEPPSETILKLAGGNWARVTAAHVFAAARKGDPTAEKLVAEFCRRFGAAIANVMKVLDPQLVILAGEIIRTEPELLHQILHWTRHFYFPLPQLPDFRLSEFTKETAILGPAAVFFSALHIPAGVDRHLSAPAAKKSRRKRRPSRGGARGKK